MLKLSFLYELRYDCKIIQSFIHWRMAWLHTHSTKTWLLFLIKVCIIENNQRERDLSHIIFASSFVLLRNNIKEVVYAKKLDGQAFRQVHISILKFVKLCFDSKWHRFWRKPKQNKCLFLSSSGIHLGVWIYPQVVVFAKAYYFYTAALRAIELLLPYYVF